jgi:hypothetical protein
MVENFLALMNFASDFIYIFVYNLNLHHAIVCRLFWLVEFVFLAIKKFH